MIRQLSVALVFTFVLSTCVAKPPAVALDEPERLFHSARVLVALNRIDEGLHILVGLTQKYPDHELTTEARLLAGEAQLKLRRFAAAVETFEAVGSMPLVDDSRRYRALAGLGLAREEQKNWCGALSAYEAVTANSPDAALRDWGRVRSGAVKAKLTTEDRSGRAFTSMSTRPRHFPSSPGAASFFDAPVRNDQCSDEAAGQAESYRRACQGSDPRGCSKLGAVYEQGIRVAADPALAAEYYRFGCDGGDAVGCTSLAAMYHRGLGVAKRPARAADLYRRACDGGDALGCANLAVLYETGVGVTADTRRAGELYRRACDLGARLVCGP